MPLGHSELLAILSIGHDTSMRGEGISLREALARTHYAALRADFAAADLLPLLSANHALIQQWVAYSEDKRTSGGWYLTGAGEIGTVEAPRGKGHFGCLEEAVAEYVLRELDFWAGLAAS
ncbi:MAG: hypothetical protein SFV15_00005 [Polyangiaceae bacterium]|nr:hypothetical protein [Polyangiaceae bacterium]